MHKAVILSILFFCQYILYSIFKITW